MLSIQHPRGWCLEGIVLRDACTLFHPLFAVHGHIVAEIIESLKLELAKEAHKWLKAQ